MTAAPTADTAPHQDFEVRPFDAPVGAEIVGLDIGRPINEADFRRIHRAHLDHHVLVFRDQQITPDQHIAFSRRFGPLEIHVLHQFHLEGHPEILIVSNIKKADGEPLGLGDAGAYWHSDISYKPHPSLGSLLHAQELPSEGGDTLFADQHLAWEGLSPGMQQRILPLKAEHSYLAKYEELRAKNPWRPKLSQAQIDKVAPAVQPVVRTHPETGRKALFVSEHFTTRIVGLPQEESDALLAELFAHSVKPEYVYRHLWAPHDLVFWDNRSLMHLAAGTPDELRRKLYRTTIEGDLPF
ncbi:taurine dioxygenase [Variovorax sp. CF079]|uniref:TauD/TfdA dioxygenase family protein n=1 Tax=Variovorax sp. CF079 TaxID=1882774 RepID=UPI0008838F03|nr:TauD/TfdA family dioxygenase [Variovorax sp. CF079]SDC67047.1 taurine dioxygenase [Variovorax sp. CF079]